MSLIYNIAIYLTELVLKCGAWFNAKLAQGVNGRKNTFKTLENSLKTSDKTLWFHCASLGEYEQGLPVFKALRNHYKDHKIVLSFFSPSGFEIRKNSPIADIVIYLPIDTKKNAKKFICLVNPELTVFVKYDIWPNFLIQIKKKQKRAILISASFRKKQTYFKFYGTQLRKALFTFEHIFTQNEISKQLLETINYTQVTVSGDTRFDRVSNQLDIDNSLDFIETFKDNKLCLVAGSTWPEDDALLINYINSKAFNAVKFIIAPHNIKFGPIKNLQEKINSETILYSERNKKSLENARVFIVDTIGILTKVYKYADIAYVGGAMGNTGLHNTLEPAVFGIPIIIGNNFDKFPEAKAMLCDGGMFSVSNQKELDKVLTELIENDNKRRKSGRQNTAYIAKNKGAVIQILNYLRI